MQGDPIRASVTSMPPTTPAHTSAASRQVSERRRTQVVLSTLVAALLGLGLFSLAAVVSPGVARAQGDLPVVGAWVEGPQTAGVVRDGRWLLRYEHASGPADTDFRYGRASDAPLAGDWDGDQRTTVAVRRDKRFYLRNSNSAGAADVAFAYGRDGDDALVGDWNGDGVQTVGVRRGSTFYLRNSNSSGAADLVYRYGRDDDEVVVGDWNGDGVETIGVRRGSTFHLRNRHAGGAADVSFVYGRDGDRALAGDWNDSGIATIGVRREARFLLRNTNNAGPADLDYRYGRPEQPEPEPAPVQLISSFTTRLVPGQDRNVNIHLAADYIDGDVIAPGETYSLNRGIGVRTRARGFIEDGFIDTDGRLISVLGGGISQMGTTFVNAAWFSGIRLDDFRQHTIYFPRYPMCREATLSWGVLDVVVTNDSPYPITIVTDHSSESVTVSIIGRPWAEVDSWIGEPYGWRGESFRVDCGRTITYPDQPASSERYSWRYDRTG
jgi:hypothetical protein